MSNGNDGKYQLGNKFSEKYRPEYCDEIVEYFENEEDFPNFAGYAAHLGVSKATIYNWAGEYPDFYEAMEKARAVQENRLLQGSMRGSYNSTIAKMVLTNRYGYTEKADVSVGNKDDKPFEVKISVEKNES